MPPVTGQWRGLEQLADDAGFLARAAEEFPGLAEALASPRDRRRALKLMAAALAMGRLGGCDFGAPSGHLIPAVRSPPNIVPGLPNFYSTAHVLNGYAAGVVVKHHMGRPIKVEGNPHHPASLGAVDAIAQAQTLDFYDPERAWEISVRGRPASWQRLLTILAAQRSNIAARNGAGLYILTGAISSPTLITQINELLATCPDAHGCNGSRSRAPMSRKAACLPMAARWRRFLALAKLMSFSPSTAIY